MELSKEARFVNHRTRKIGLSVILVLLLGSIAAVAQMGLTPFSADMSVKSKQGHDMTGKVYFSGSKMRMDMNGEGHEMAMIHDMPNKVSYMLMPQQKMYMEMRAGQNMMRRGPKIPDLKSYDPDHPCANQPDTTCEKVGSETVNGRSTDKWIFKNTKNGETTTAWVD